MMSICIVVTPKGIARSVYDDRLNLRGLGAPDIQRGSHVEPNADGLWSADLSPVGGPQLGPFDKRSDAIAAEVAWLQEHWLTRSAE